MKIGFIKRSWHEPGKVVPTVTYRLYDEDCYSGWPSDPITIQGPEFIRACRIVEEAEIGGHSHSGYHIRPEQVQIVIAVLRLAGYELGNCPE